ncbi:MAG: enolase C-terminal domain-like protein [Bdellovibrio sp.]|jgi:O-succinylbenzoate synthase
MLKFWSHKYTLHPLTQIGALAENKPRSGALLKIQWPDKKIGYADLFPWPELGDAELESELATIERGQFSHLVEQSILLARQDAVLRSSGKNAFQDLAKVNNHFLITDCSRLDELTIEDMKKSGFTTAKIKVGRNPEEEAKWIDRFLRTHQMTVRLDFNSKGTFKSFENFVRALSPAVQSRIEYVEDPFPYDPELWAAANQLRPLALDQEYDKVAWDNMKAPVPFKVVVIKPARQDVKKAVDHANKFGLNMVVTSSLDHPVGIAHSLLVAGELKKFYPDRLLDCGCLSLRSYEANDFSKSMIVQGSYLVEIPGLGIGFDNLFERMTWAAL